MDKDMINERNTNDEVSRSQESSFISEQLSSSEDGRQVEEAEKLDSAAKQKKKIATQKTRMAKNKRKQTVVIHQGDTEVTEDRKSQLRNVQSHERITQQKSPDE